MSYRPGNKFARGLVGSADVFWCILASANVFNVRQLTPKDENLTNLLLGHIFKKILSIQFLIPVTRINKSIYL